MGQNQFLVVGGSGEAGQSAINYLKTNSKSLVIATTTGNEPVPNADISLFEIKAEPNLSHRILENLGEKNLSSQFEAIIYTPALGEVGFPIRETTKSQLDDALRISYDPILELESTFNPRLMIGYSAFYWLPHTFAFYGSMGFVKYKMDKWCLENPTKRKLLRAGTFFSKSVRGIGLVLQRTMKKTNDPDLLNLKSKFESSGQKFSDFFLSYAWENEKKYFEDENKTNYRPTSREDLSRGLKVALESNEPITTVLGDWTWTESQLPDLPNFFKKFD